MYLHTVDKYSKIHFTTIYNFEKRWVDEANFVICRFPLPLFFCTAKSGEAGRYYLLHFACVSLIQDCVCVFANNIDVRSFQRARENYVDNGLASWSAISFSDVFCDYLHNLRSQKPLESQLAVINNNWFFWDWSGSLHHQQSVIIHFHFPHLIRQHTCDSNINCAPSQSTELSSLITTLCGDCGSENELTWTMQKYHNGSARY